MLMEILKGLITAYKNGLNIPIIYNTSGYETKQTIDLLSGIIDIYLADIKYVTSNPAKKGVVRTPFT